MLDPTLTADDLPGRIPGFDALVVRSTKVPAAVFDAADRLALVIRAGAGTNTIDTDAAAAHGVFVSNVPGRNAAAVAELTMGLLLAIDRRIADNVADLRAGTWNKSRYSKAAGRARLDHGHHRPRLDRSRRGRAGRRRSASGSRPLAKPDRPERAVTRIEDLGITLCESLPDLLATSDIVSLHVPAKAATRGMVDADFLAQMKPGAILLNTSRGEIVDEPALLAALDAGTVRAGLDVFADEPGGGSGEWVSPLAQHPGVVGTHHIGASTEQAQQAIAAGVADIVDEVRDRGDPALRQPRAAAVSAPPR